MSVQQGFMNRIVHLLAELFKRVHSFVHLTDAARGSCTFRADVIK